MLSAAEFGGFPTFPAISSVFRPSSAEILITIISPIVLKASRADAAPLGTKHIA